MTTISIDYIVLDDKGVARVAGSRSKVTQIVCDVRNGMTPERIHEEYPHLSLAQIHAALSYYQDHRHELDTQIEQSLRADESLAATAGATLSREELEKRADDKKEG